MHPSAWPPTKLLLSWVELMADEGKRTVDVRLSIPEDLLESATNKQVDIAQLLRVALENELKRPEVPRRPELRDLRSQR